MNIRIKSIEHQGIHDHETIIFEVLKACDTGKFILFNKTHSKVVHSFWFPDKCVQQGDLIAVHTRPGEDCSEVHGLSSTHHFFWNLPTPIWGERRDCAVLVEANDWSFQPSNMKAA